MQVDRKNVRRAHLLALEDELSELGGDLAVVDDEGGLAWGEREKS